MPLIPTALSLLATYMSPILVLGIYLMTLNIYLHYSKNHTKNFLQLLLARLRWRNLLVWNSHVRNGILFVGNSSNCSVDFHADFIQFKTHECLRGKYL